MKNQTSTSKRLHETLRSMIESMPNGQKLPSEPELARQLNVSRATLREVMRTFETQGRIHRRQGAGTFVSRPSQIIESGLEVLESIETIARRIGLPVALGEQRMEVRPATEDERATLALSPGSQVLHVARIILADGQPAAYLIDILSANILSVEELQNSFTGSVLDLLLKRSDLSFLNSRAEVNAVTATPEIARAMGIQRGDVLLNFEALLYDRSGKVIVHSYSYFLPGHFRFHVVRRVGRPD